MIKIARLFPPYPDIDVSVLPEQEQFIDPVPKALATMKTGEIPFLIMHEGTAVGFFTLRPSIDDEVQQLRGERKCTLLSFMVDSRHQGTGFASDALRLLPAVASDAFEELVSVGLTVNCRNTQAYKLYSRNGFVDEGELYLGGCAGPQHVMVMPISSRVVATPAP